MDGSNLHGKHQPSLRRLALMLMLLKTAVNVCWNSSSSLLAGSGAGKQSVFFFSPPTSSVSVLSLLKSDGDSRRVGLSPVSLPRRRGRAAGEARYETQGERRRGPT